MVATTVFLIAPDVAIKVGNTQKIRKYHIVQSEFLITLL